eukprot:jgi/Mesvir1/22204/Mv18799-RA.1
MGISYDKYNTLRQLLSCMFDEATQSYLPRTTSAGANFPKLPTKHKIAEEMKNMLEEMGIEQSEDGTLVTSSLLAALMQDLRADPSGFKGRQKLLYQILGDGAKMARGFKALSIAGRLMRHQGQPGSEVWMHQSPSKLQELVMSKGRDDDYNILGTYPCPWCHMSKGQLHEWTLGRVVHDLRTLEDMRKMAHAYGEFPYDCPACGLHFHDEDDQDESEPRNPTQSAAFARAHYGQFFGRPPIFNVPLTHIILCMLHMELNMVTTWLQRVVLDHLLAKDEDTLLHVLKDKVHCAVKKEQVKARKKTQGKGDLSERVTIIGREAHSVLNSGDMLLDIVFPPGHNMRPVMQGSLDALRGFWKEVARPFEDDGVEGSPVRQGVADRVKAAAIKASDALVKATAAENLTLYYHIAVDHLPTAILKWD